MPNPPLYQRGTCYQCTAYGGNHAELPTATICLRPDDSGKDVSRLPEDGCTAWRLRRRVIVCGARHYTDRDRVFRALDFAHRQLPLSLVIHGAAPGAELLADQWASDRGVPRRLFPPDVDKYKTQAGAKNNAAMIRFGAEGVIAFPGDSITADCVRQALAAGLMVWQPFP